MDKKIIILNGSPRPNGNTSTLINAFIAGAEDAGNTVTRFDLQQMNILPCLGCLGGGKDADMPCVQNDEMTKIYPHYAEADVVVFASPMYFWSITAQLKCALDRLFAVAECFKHGTISSNVQKKSVLLMPATGHEFDEVNHYYDSLIRHMGMEDLGKILVGSVRMRGDIQNNPALEEARSLGNSIT